MKRPAGKPNIERSEQEGRTEMQAWNVASEEVGGYEVRPAE